MLSIFSVPRVGYQSSHDSWSHLSLSLNVHVDSRLLAPRLSQPSKDTKYYSSRSFNFTSFHGRTLHSAPTALKSNRSDSWPAYLRVLQILRSPVELSPSIRIAQMRQVRVDVILQRRVRRAKLVNRTHISTWQTLSSSSSQCHARCACTDRLIKMPPGYKDKRLGSSRTLGAGHM